ADDLVFHFKQMRLPDYKQWSRKFFSAGYRDMEELRDADLTEVFGELQIPSGIQTILQKGVSEFKAGTFAAAFPMPREDLDATAPRQADSEWGSLVMTGLGMLALGDCLDGDTKITMSDRSQKKIQDLNAGDQILTFNKGKTKVKTILKVETGTSRNMRSITLRRTTGEAFSIKATEGHPFYTKANAWAVLDPSTARFDTSKPVASLGVGEEVILRRGNLAKVSGLAEVLPRQKTYNLQVDGPGTFFAEGILSHSGLPPLKKQ
ncbi:unnamed protein product, partial [Effrenium voratum]